MTSPRLRIAAAVTSVLAVMLAVVVWAAPASALTPSQESYAKQIEGELMAPC